MGTAHIHLALAMLIVSLGVSGCGTLNSMVGGNSVQEANSKIVWNYEKESIVLLAEPQPTLNQVSGKSHTLAILIVQTNDVNQLVKINENENAIADLLERKLSSSVLAVNHFFLEPSCNKTFVADRAQNAKYVGVFAGYFDKPKEGFGKFYEIGTQVIKSGRVVKTYTVEPERLVLRIGFGSESITNSETLAADYKFETKDSCSH